MYYGKGLDSHSILAGCCYSSFSVWLEDGRFSVPACDPLCDARSGGQKWPKARTGATRSPDNVGMRSGRHPALLPGAPLRTGRESYPSSGSSHCRAVAASHVVRVMAPPVYRHKVVRVVCPACVSGLVMMPIDEADVLFGIELDTTQGTCATLTFEQVSPPLPVGR